MQCNYDVGDVFLVPLDGGGFVRGVVVRFDGGGEVFGRFYPPVIIGRNDARVDDLNASSQAILIGAFGDLGLIEEQWPVVGKIEQWEPSEWQMVSLVNSSSAVEQPQPINGLMGDQYVEQLLTILLQDAAYTGQK